MRSSCCPDYTYVAGRCIPQDVDPCSMNLCEQRCSVYFGKGQFLFIGTDFESLNKRERKVAIY